MKRYFAALCFGLKEIVKIVFLNIINLGSLEK